MNKKNLFEPGKEAALCSFFGDSLSRFNVDAAKENYLKSFDIIKQLVAANPHSEELQRDLALSYEYLGDIAQGQNNTSEAFGYFQKSLHIFQILSKNNPTSLLLKDDIAREQWRIDNLFPSSKKNKHSSRHRRKNRRK